MKDNSKIQSAEDTELRSTCSVPHDDVVTLKHLASEGMGDNLMRALASGFAYLEAWCVLATGAPCPCPPLKVCFYNL